MNRRFDALADVRNGVLHIGGLPSESFLVESPNAYVYDLGVVEEKIRALSVLPKSVLVYYALKANPALAIARHISSLGLGMDVASSGELYCAQKVGHSMSRTLFTGPAKSPDEIDMAVRSGIQYIHCESLDEARLISSSAQAHGICQNILLRVNTSFDVSGGAIRTTGGPQKFGIDQESVLEIATLVQQLPGVRLCGIQCFSASNILDADLLSQNAKRVLDFALDLEKRLSIRLDTVDIGGGIGIPYCSDQAPFDLELFSARLEPAVQSFGRPVIMELGRFLVGESGYYLSRVVSVKESRGRQMVLTAGGINHQLRPALMGPHPVLLANRSSSGPQVASFVGGPLCTSLDYFVQDAPFPLAHTGDVVAVLNSGAYGYTEGMQSFLSFDQPPEYCVQNGVCQLTRPAVSAESRVDAQTVFNTGEPLDRPMLFPSRDAHV